MNAPFDSVGSKPALGSLAQSARGKQIRQARSILIIIGVLIIILNAFMLTTLRSQVKNEIEKQIRQLPAGSVVDPAKTKEVEDQAVKIGTAVSGVVIFLGVLFVVFGLIVNLYPVPVTVTSLVLYLGATAVFGFLDPTTFVQGIIFKIIIVMCLIKAVQAAIAAKKEEAPPAFATSET